MLPKNRKRKAYYSCNDTQRRQSRIDIKNNFSKINDLLIERSNFFLIINYIIYIIKHKGRLIPLTLIMIILKTL